MSECIACGTETDNVEAVCLDCGAKAREKRIAKEALAALSDEEVMPGPRGPTPANSARAEITNVAIAERLGVNERTVRRARREVLEDRGLLDERLPPIAHNQGGAEWYTPSPIVEAARALMGGIDWDPASSAEANETVRAGRFATAQDDGLSVEWPHARTWLNPPWTRGLMGAFAERLLDVRPPAAVFCGPSRTETQPMQALTRACVAQVHVAGRVFYSAPDRDRSTGGTEGTILWVLGDDMTPAAVEEHMGHLGVVLCPR